ncbi:hypothetical protein CDD83_3349 [Cordyceps sp. RAO-2017]|nr:hypothetical protein CDD83_3349 [Cordyceps sp. RAO-2017]
MRVIQLIAAFAPLAAAHNANDNAWSKNEEIFRCVRQCVPTMLENASCRSSLLQTLCDILRDTGESRFQVCAQNCGVPAMFARNMKGETPNRAQVRGRTALTGLHRTGVKASLLPGVPSARTAYRPPFALLRDGRWGQDHIV